MKTFETKAVSEPDRQPAAAPGHQRVPSAEQRFGVSPRQLAQRQTLARLQSNADSAPAQLNGKGGGKKGGDKPKVSAAEARKRREQSKADRQANAAAKYSKDSVKYQEKHLSAKEVREINKKVKGHASRDGGKKQNAATTKSQAEAREATAKKIAEKKQKERERKDKEVEDWRKDFHRDKDDRGGAGGASAILVGGD